ncbi:MAG: 4Fe-4S binding protein [Spirochaetaceae bacterium]|nr:MAG: 4Fe-4S binding protein [Spirochaetaceae bacterium]
MGVVATIPEKCKRCYSCVRECPAKAIKVIGGQATVIEEQCIGCGNCVKVCAQKAKRIEDSMIAVRAFLESKVRTFACLAPSFPVAFHPTHPGRIISALRKLGFGDIWEVAFGAELISREYAKLFKDALQNGKYVISTPCPAIVSYIEKYMPTLHDALAPIVSPMIAVGRAIRQRYGSGVRIVFIGPCIAKKNEIRDPNVQGTVDAVLTFEEMQSLIRESGIDPEQQKISDFDGPACYLGRTFPISGGLLRTTGLQADILENDVLITEGKNRVLGVLKEMEEGKSKAKLFDLLFCEGCINGPKMPVEMSVFTRKEQLTDYIIEQNRFTVRRELTEALAEFDDLDLSREFSRQTILLPHPSEEDIARTLKAMRKFGPEDQLNCGSCGYPTCRDKAVAVCQGLAEIEMCLPYLVEELETTLRELQESHRELASAQNRLIQTERLASMGQISAGVAHEINNPLSTILLYAHMLLKHHKQEDGESEEVQMILSEATRCRTIMRGLLDFARQSRVVKEATNLGALIEEVIDNLRLKIGTSPVRIEGEIQSDLPKVKVDADQIRQMLVNLVQNGLDAIDGTGKIVISARKPEDQDCLEIQVRDTGRGIPPEVLSEIFTPFFTTKQLGKGTGMGLSIVYGVVKMHSGEISVDSDVGKGTTFTIRLPLSDVKIKQLVGIGEPPWVRGK